MLRGMSAQRFQELAEYEALDSPEMKMDLRFAILASVVAASGGVKAKDGQLYGQQHFLTHLQACIDAYGDSLYAQAVKPKELEAPKQSVSEMTRHLEDWISGSNQVYKETRRGRR